MTTISIKDAIILSHLSKRVPDDDSWLVLYERLGVEAKLLADGIKSRKLQKMEKRKG